MPKIKLFDSEKIKKIHFIGIGGVSMSGLAELLHDMDYNISGSDVATSYTTEKLIINGIRVDIGHSADNIKSPDLVVYTAAINEANPELIKARESGCLVIDRASLLGEIMKHFPNTVAVSGTHGKTTTTSMITMIMLESNLDPTIHIGGELDAIAGSTRIGNSDFFVAEACEYARSFLKFNPNIAVLLNIDLDHLDIYKDIEDIKDTFFKFASLVPKDGYLIAFADDKNTMDVVSKIDSCQKITFGITSDDADWKATNISLAGSIYASFDVLYKDETLGRVDLSVPGIHHVINALAAIVTCYVLGCDFNSIVKGLKKYIGTHRRFEFKYEINGATVIDDYAHHPSEVTATMEIVRKMNASRVWAVYQPHTYSRTKKLLEDFSKAFDVADKIIVTEIFAAREIDTGLIHSTEVVEKLKQNGKDAIYIKDFDSAAKYLKENLKPGDVMITLGCGDVYKLCDVLYKLK